MIRTWDSEKSWSPKHFLVAAWVSGLVCRLFGGFTSLECTSSVLVRSTSYSVQVNFIRLFWQCMMGKVVYRIFLGFWEANLRKPRSPSVEKYRFFETFSSKTQSNSGLECSQRATNCRNGRRKTSSFQNFFPIEKILSFKKIRSIYVWVGVFFFWSSANWAFIDYVTTPVILKVEYIPVETRFSHIFFHTYCHY